MQTATQQIRRTIFWQDEEREAVREHVYEVLRHEGKKFPIIDGHGLAQLAFDGQSIVLPSTNRHRPISSFKHPKETAAMIEWLNKRHAEAQRNVKPLKIVPQATPPAEPPKSEFFAKKNKPEAPANPFNPPPQQVEGTPQSGELVTLLNRTLALLEQNTQRSMQQDQLILQALVNTQQALVSTMADLQFNVHKLTEALVTFRPQIHLNVEAPEGSTVSATVLDDETPQHTGRPSASVDDIPQAGNCKPKVVIYGLFPNQKQEILSEFGDMLDLRIYENTLSVKPVENVVKAYYMIKTGHKQSTKSGRQFYGDRFEPITGSTSMLKAKIHELLETITA